MEKIKHPAHYAEGRKYEPYKVIKDWDLNFNLGNAVKYLSRAGRKDNAVVDLKKAIEYIQFELEAIEGEQENTTEPVEVTIQIEGGYVPTHCIDEVASTVASNISNYIRKSLRERAGMRDENN